MVSALTNDHSKLQNLDFANAGHVGTVDCGHSA
jgi:hypothetical protein